MRIFLFILCGAFLAVGLVLIAARIGDYRKEKRFYALGLIIAALIYTGFGAFSGSFSWLLAEIAGVLFFTVFAAAGLRFSGWFLSVGWALHAGWDVVLHGQAADFVPYWYQIICLGFDFLLAGYIGSREWRLK